ncbi:ROK family transcriptional regulator [Paenibacillus antri]|uniref:ROK family transcriptional regulator n=1 Tax=Paenibacillus antri TaxID=2582848 RepID=A0A5R9GLJ3_9BACL|nr:ROK family transcriptional regulator [Paenibacillus antri]TLS53993.1 ROK family transcriptional regulator [Paenibacillus antri]
MAGTRGRGPTLSKDINRKLIYEALKRRGTTTRTELSAALGLTKNTVNAIVEELASAGYVRMTGLTVSGGAGRKALGVAFEPANRKALGFQLLSRSILAVTTDLCGTPLEREELPLSETTPEATVAAVAAHAAAAQAAEPNRPLVGVGLGVPALVDPASGRVALSTHLGWRDVPLRAMLADALPLGRILVDNSVKLAAQGELWFGAGRGTNHFAYCSFGAGVGCGIAIGGDIVRGEGGLAGELGHTVVEPDGPRCACGNAGCLEAVAGLPALFARVAAATGEPPERLDAASLAERARQGDEAVLRELTRVGRAIGVALAPLVNLLNPRYVVCDGPLMLASDTLFPIIRQEMRGRSLSPASAQAELVRSSLHPLATAVGAAAGVVRAWEHQADPLEPIPF